MKILVVEDDAEVRDCYVAFFRSYFFDVDAAANGEEGIRLYRENPQAIGLILTDGEMPAGDGAWLAREVRATPGGESVTILLISGNPEKYSKSNDAALFTEIAGKPMSGRDFWRLLERYLM